MHTHICDMLVKAMQLILVHHFHKIPVQTPAWTNPVLSLCSLSAVTEHTFMDAKSTTWQQLQSIAHYTVTNSFTNLYINVIYNTSTNQNTQLFPSKKITELLAIYHSKTIHIRLTWLDFYIIWFQQHYVIDDSFKTKYTLYSLQLD